MKFIAQITKLTNKTDIYSGLLLIIIIFGFCLWSEPNLIPKKKPDSWGYLRLADDFTNEVSEERPFFFPLVIRFCKELSGPHWEEAYSIIQICFHTIISVWLFFLFQEFQIKKTVAFILTLFIGFNPSLVYYSTHLLADHLLAVLTTLSWIFMIRFIMKYDNRQNFYIELIFIGVFSGLAIVTKPQSILSIFPLMFAFVFTSKKSIKMISPLILLLIINFSFHFLWEKYKSNNNPNTSFEFLDYIEYPINMTAIRGGLVDYGDNTPFYDFLEKRKLLPAARKLEIKLSYTMDENPNFSKLHEELRDDWDIKNDKEFTKKILSQVPVKLFIYSISNWHAFFTKRSFGPGDGSFPYMPKIIRYFYVVGYSLLYRPLLVILLLTSFIILWQKRFLALLISSGGILLYASLTIAILSAHGGEFPRYRVWVEYIMWFCALIPVGYIIQYFFEKMKRSF